MLVKLYSDSNLLFRDITFKQGINIILGKYSNSKNANGINGIGKSTTVRLISYLFLSDSEERRFKDHKYDFLRKEKHNISIHFMKNNINYIIKRHFNDNDFVYFGNSPKELNKFTKRELKEILCTIFFPIINPNIIFEGNKFGSLISFFVKDDLDHHKRINPVNFLPAPLSDKQMAIYNFYLLNLPNRNIITFNNLSREYDEYSKTKKSLEKKIVDDTGKSIQEIKTERLELETSIFIIKSSLEKYEFLDNYKQIEKDLIELTKKINNKLKEYQVFDIQLKQIKNNFQQGDVEIDINSVQKIYNDIIEGFGNFVRKEFDEVLNFRKSISENRAKFYLKKEAELEESIKNILNEITSLEKERSKGYKLLDEKGALESIKNSYEELIEKKTNLESTLHVLKQIDEIQSYMNSLNVELSSIKRDISLDITNNSEQLYELRKEFQKILKNAIFVDEQFHNAYFDIEQNTKGNRNLPFSIKVEVPKGDALGQQMLKLIAYDLMVFFNSISMDRNLPDFLIHDGVFHGISFNSKINTLNYVYSQSLLISNFQYILTFNEDEIEISDDKSESYGRFNFDWKDCIVAEYQDTEEKMIFKRNLEKPSK